MKIVNDFQSLTIFPKSFILDVWKGSKYASVLQLMKTNKPNKIKKNQDISNISVLETLKKFWNKPYSESEWFTCKANFSSWFKIFFTYQSHANFLYLINKFCSVYRFILTIFLFKRNLFYVSRNLLYSFVLMLFLKRPVKSLVWIIK